MHIVIGTRVGWKKAKPQPQLVITVIWTVYTNHFHGTGIVHKLHFPPPNTSVAFAFDWKSVSLKGETICPEPHSSKPVHFSTTCYYVEQQKRGNTWVTGVSETSAPHLPLFTAYWILSRLVRIMKCFSKSNLKSMKIRYVKMFPELCGCHPREAGKTQHRAHEGHHVLALLGAVLLWDRSLVSSSPSVPLNNPPFFFFILPMPSLSCKAFPVNLSLLWSHFRGVRPVSCGP